MLLLAIETSCDETAAAVLDEERLYGDVVSSQLRLHQAYGGVVPEIASRAHLQAILPTIEETLHKSSVTREQIEAIAVTRGPGLIGALLVGVNFAKAFAYANDIPLIGVNHLEGHIFANQLDHPGLQPPMITLLISGGHSLLVWVQQWGRYQILGHTIDDAVGEAFDKVAKMLTLGYPGGPVIDHRAREGNPHFVHFPRALMKNENFNFSFSGLKTAVLNYIESQSKHFVHTHLPDICASFQQAVSDVLIEKTVAAARKYQVQQIALAGGVARNTFLRDAFLQRAKAEDLSLFFPSPEYCTDNAAMIGRAGLYHLLRGRESSFALEAVPNLPLKSVEPS